MQITLQGIVHILPKLTFRCKKYKYFLFVITFLHLSFIMLYGGFYHGEFYSFKLPRQQK